jgi:GDP-4-dehydro-6-deoxy-D-mannose reductase
MRALITGINGFVGGHLAEHLLAAGRWEVWGLARQPSLTLAPLAGRVRYVAADMTDLDQVVSAVESARPDIIYHLAGQSNVPRSFADPAGTLMANLTAQTYLFQALLRLRQDALILVVTSNEIYGAVRREDLPLDEETPLRPVNPYAVSKAAQDLLALQYFASHRLRTIRLRPFNHIGYRAAPERRVRRRGVRGAGGADRGRPPAAPDARRQPQRRAGLHRCARYGAGLRAGRPQR